MKGLVERVFERLLWNSRFVVVVAVIGSVAAGFALFYLATIDVIYLVAHLAPYAGDMTDAARAELRSNTVTHVVEVVGQRHHRHPGEHQFGGKRGVRRGPGQYDEVADREVARIVDHRDRPARCPANGLLLAWEARMQR